MEMNKVTLLGRVFTNTQVSDFWHTTPPEMKTLETSAATPQLIYL
jgi:hypothetical protein